MKKIILQFGLYIALGFSLVAFNACNDFDSRPSNTNQTTPIDTIGSGNTGGNDIDTSGNGNMGGNDIDTTGSGGKNNTNTTDVGVVINGITW
ncbi:MAG: hypothetical protein LBR55_02630, partial [Bacteroidales bacterium]|nr:hypothetical protein [Bacteroidales bacterium]